MIFSFHLRLVNYHPNPHEPITINDFLIGVSIPIVMVTLVSIWFYVLKQRILFSNTGTFNNPNVHYEKNDLDLFVGVAVIGVIRDPRNYRQKGPHLLRGLRKYGGFRKIESLDETSYEELLKRPPKFKPMTAFINKHITHDKKVKMANLLCCMCICDKDLEDEEIQCFDLFLKYINVSIGELDVELKAIYEEILSENWKNKQKDSVSNASITKRSVALSMLGLNENAKETEIKVQYRKLVKMTHPDRLIGEDPHFIAHMQRKFHDIQRAYDYLTKG